MLESFVQTYGYWAVLVGTFLEGETVLVIGGFVAHRGFLNLFGVMLAAFAGSLTSDQLFFFLGRCRGKEVLRWRPHWTARIERLDRLLERYDTAVILGFRFLYGLRNVAPFALGMSRVGTARFMLLNVVGAAIWAVAVAAAGYALGSAAESLLGDLHRYELILIGAMVLIGVSLALVRRYVVR